MADPASYRPAPGSIPEARGSTGSATSDGRVIYVGKARSLRPRLSSYFQDLAEPAPAHPDHGDLRGRRGVDRGQHRGRGPAAGVQLDQGVRPAVQRQVPRRQELSRASPSPSNEEFPRLQVMRGPKKKGVRYFGPYSHAWAIRETLDLLLRVFPARTCSAGVFKRAGQVGRPCLLGYIGKCSAPCVGRVSAEEHRQIVEDFCDFMAGQTTTYLRRLEKDMQVAAAEPGVRAGGPAARRHQGPRARDGEAVGGAGRRHRRRRRRLRRGPARGGGAGVLRPRRPDPRPARLGGRQGRGPHDRRPGGALPPAGVRRVATEPGDAGWGDSVPREVLVPGAAAGRRGGAGVAARTCGAAASTSGCRSAGTSGP